MEKITLRIAKQTDVPEIYDVMNTVHNNIDSKEYYYADNIDFIKRHISKNGFIIAACTAEKIIGFLIIRFPKNDDDNLGIDIGMLSDELNYVAHMESAAVLPNYRGYGLQKKLIEKAEIILKNQGYKFFMATIHPQNYVSLNNLQELGYKIEMTKKKYGGINRHILLKSVKEEHQHVGLRI